MLCCAVVRCGVARSLESAIKLIRSSEGRPVAIEVSREGAKPTVKMVQVRMDHHSEINPLSYCGMVYLGMARCNRVNHNAA